MCSLFIDIVEMHGGSLSAHSLGLGHGSTFSIELPLQLSLQTVDAAGVSPMAVTDTGMTTRKRGSRDQAYLFVASEDEESGMEMTPSNPLSVDTYSPIHAAASNNHDQRNFPADLDTAEIAATTFSNSFICRKVASLYEKVISKYESIAPFLQSRTFLFGCVFYYCTGSIGLCVAKIRLDLPHTEYADAAMIERYPLPIWYFSAVLFTNSDDN